MDGKSKYEKKKREIEKYKKMYNSRSKKNKTYVIFFFDCDDYDTSIETQNFLKKAMNFCNKNDFLFVWFCKDIERVYLGKKVVDKEKGKEAIKFKRQKLINNVKIENLIKIYLRIIQVIFY